MRQFTIQQIVLELDGGRLAAVVINAEQRVQLERMLPTVFEREAIQVVALDGLKMVPLPTPMTRLIWLALGAVIGSAATIITIFGGMIWAAIWAR